MVVAAEPVWSVVICGNPIDWLHQAISDVLTAFLTTLAHTFGDAIVRFINDVNFITHTPENLTYNNALVRQFTTATQVLADGLLAVVVLVSGYNIMVRPYLGSTYAGVAEFLPRRCSGRSRSTRPPGGAAWRSMSTTPCAVPSAPP